MSLNSPNNPQTSYNWNDEISVVLSSWQIIPVTLNQVKENDFVGYICSSCKSPTTLAEWKCGSCGNPFEPLELDEAKELFPSVAVKEIDPNRIAYLLLHRGWICLYCNSYNVNFPRTGSNGEWCNCVNCGAGFENWKSILLEDSDVLDISEDTVANFRQKVLSIIESRKPKQPQPTRPTSPRVIRNHLATQFSSPVMAHPSTRNKWMILTGALWGVLIISYLVYEGFIKEHDAEITILWHAWERVVRIEKYDERGGSDWKKNVNPNSYAWFRVVNTILKEAPWDSYEVQVGTKPAKDTSNCLSWNKSCSTPTSTLSGGVTVRGKETCVKTTCATYGTKMVPNMVTHYRKHQFVEFRYMDWWAHLSLSTEGNDKTPYWHSTANYTIDNTTLRLGSKSESYRIALRDEKGKQETLTLPFEVWNKLSPGTTCNVKSTNWWWVVTNSVKAAVESCIEK